MKRFFHVFFIFSLLLFILFSFVYLTLPTTSVLKTENPGITALMQQRLDEAARSGTKLKIKQKWVAFRDIPELLKQSVRISEDAGFYLHEGIDLHELEEAIKTNFEEGYFKRGASTITQQLAKNIYLSTERTLIRKLREYLIARRLETTLTKYRIFHLYLNVIEFGDGIFGVEAAALFYFNKNVSDLTPEEIIRLTAIIPKPLSEDPLGQSEWLYWRCCWISQKLHQYNYIDIELFQELSLEFCD